MDTIRSGLAKWAKVVLPAVVWLILFPMVCAAGESGDDRRVPEGVYLHLTREFDDYLSKTGRGDGVIRSEESVTYTNDPSLRYMREIAAALRLLVKAELAQVKHQEEVLTLLRDLAAKRR